MKICSLIFLINKIIYNYSRALFLKVGESSSLVFDVVNNFVLLVPLPLRVNNFNTLEFFIKPYRLISFITK